MDEFSNPMVMWGKYRRKRLRRCVDWSKINDRETFMKGINYSYYYEQED